MNGYLDNIEEVTISNDNFRKVLYTGKYSQLVVMSLKPGEEIGVEVHDNVDQFFRVEKGSGKLIKGGEEFEIKEEMAIIIPAGVEHNIINNSEGDLKLYTIYSPSNHPENTVHKTKEEADIYERSHH